MPLQRSKATDQSLQGRSELQARAHKVQGAVRSDDLGLGQVMALLAENWKSIAASVALAVAAAAIYLLFAAPQFTASSLLLIDTRNNTLTTPQVRATDANSESAYVETQVGILNSERVIRTVLVEKKLYELPEFKPNERAVPLARGKAAAPAADAGDEKDLAIASPIAVREFRRRLTVKRVPSTHIIEIGFTFSDPKEAAAIANAVAHAYISDQIKSREQAVQGTSQWLRQRTRDLKKQTQAAETALDDFRSNNPNGGSSSRSVLRELESTAQTYRMISESFQKRFLEMSQELYFLSPDARVVSEAWPPSERSHPKRLLTLAIAVAIGLASGFLVALGRCLLA